MVDLSELKAGDTVVFRDGTSSEVQDISVKKNDNTFPYFLSFEDGKRTTYTRDGYYFSDEDINDRDIVEIIPQETEQKIIRNHVDLHNIAEGDSVYCDDGSEHIVDNVTFDQNYAVITFYDFGTFEFNYDGTKFQEDAEVGNIVHILHGDPMPTKEPPKPSNDTVNHPSHYTSGGIECIEAIKASMVKGAYKGYLKGNILKYIWRYEKKEKPVEDLKKARTYLDWLIKENEE